MPNGPPGFTGYSITAGRRLRCGLLSVCARALPILGLLGIYGGAVASATTPTLTTLSVTANGLPVANIQPDTVITLTASVAAGGKAVSPGTINFCDASAAYCTDIHQIGTAQLTSSGTATYKFRPGPGNHSYKAVFVGTKSYFGSNSGPATLTVGGSGVPFLVATGIPGNYTLTEAIPGNSLADPTGTVTFNDTTANVVLGKASLIAGPVGPGFVAENPPVGRAPSYSATGDFNGDGVPDLAVTSENGSTVTILLGNGDGNFTQGTTLSVFPYVTENLVVGDFNNDGRADLAVVTSSDYSGGAPIGIFLGNGDGTFTSVSGALDGQSALGVALGDFNNDGNQDLAITNTNGVPPGSVTILLGKGDGTFAPLSARPPTGPAPTCVATGDFNGDGYTDLAVGDESRITNILLGNGDGTFVSAASLTTDYGTFDIVTADFNGDGKLDLAMANETTPGANPLDVFLGKGDGTFAPVAAAMFSATTTSSVAVADLNGDGIPDLAATDNANDAIAILLGNGDGTFTQAAINPATGQAPIWVLVTDLNGDGVPDIAVSNQISNNFTVLLTLAGPSSIATLTGVSVTGPGIHYAQGLYPGDANFPASASNLVPLLAALTPTTSVLTVTPTSTTYGSTVTLSAVVRPTTPPGYGAPTGSVTFYDGSTVIGTSFIQNGSAVLTLTTLPAGTDGLTCTYNGDNVYAVSQCNTVPIVVGAATTTLTLTSSLNPAPPLTRVTFTATLTNGTVSAGTGQAITLTLNGQTINLTTNSSGMASYSISTLTPGSYPVTATFAGSNTLLASSAMLTEVITAFSTATSLTISPNPAYLGQLVTMTANVTASGGTVNTGSVVFTDAGTTLATQPVTAGSAIFTTSTLAVGTHPTTATYAPGNPVYLGSASTVVNEVILPSGFQIALSPTTITLPPGATGTDGILLASVGNFAGPLALTFGPLPTYATGAISPTTVTLTAGGAGASTLTLKTLLKASNELPSRPGNRPAPMIFAAITLLLLPLTARRRFPRLLFVALLAVGMQALIGCTNSWYTAEVVAHGTYQIPITATDIHNNTQSATLTVIVTP